MQGTLVHLMTMQGTLVHFNDNARHSRTLKLMTMQGTLVHLLTMQGTLVHFNDNARHISYSLMTMQGTTCPYTHIHAPIAARSTFLTNPWVAGRI